MPVIASAVDPRAAEFRANAGHMHELTSELSALVTSVMAGGGERAREKHLARGKLLPRDRIEALLDRGSPFLEFSSLAAHGLYDNQAPSAGLITGIGRVHGREVVIVARLRSKNICAHRR